MMGIRKQSWTRMFHHAKKQQQQQQQQQSSKWILSLYLMNQNTNGVNFELTDDNNRSEKAAKNDIFRGTANYTTS